MPSRTAIAYRRVSKEDQAREGKSSLEDQMRAMTGLAAKLRASIDHVFTDPGVSGATAEDRPAFMAMVEHCESHPQPAKHPGYVFALNDSRWGRFTDVEEGAFWRVRLRRSGWVVRFAEGDDVEDPTARTVLRAIGGAQASAYLEALRANCKRGTRGAAARGLWLTKAPIGFRRQATGGGKAPQLLEHGQRKADDQEVRLALGPAEEVALVRELFVSYASGRHTLGSLVRAMKDRWPAKRWSRAVLHQLLMNPAYSGDVVWCRSEKADRTRQVHRPVDDWVIVRDAHPAIIDRALFEAVQQRLRDRHRPIGKKRLYILSGLIRCSVCDSPLIGGGGQKGTHADPDRYAFYRENDAWLDRGCAPPMATISARWLERRVVSEIADVVTTPAVTALILEEVERVYSDEASGGATRRAQLERERRKLDDRRRRLAAAIADGVIQKGEAREELASIRAGLDRVTEELERAKFGERAAMVAHSEAARVARLATDFEQLATRASGRALRELIRPWLAGGVFDKAHRRITLSVRTVPSFVLSASPGRGRPEEDGLLIQRVIEIPVQGRSATGQFTAREEPRRRRAAGGHR